jgi:hypothetical protein
VLAGVGWFLLLVVGWLDMWQLKNDIDKSKRYDVVQYCTTVNSVRSRANISLASTVLLAKHHKNQATCCHLAAPQQLVAHHTPHTTDPHNHTITQPAKQQAQDPAPPTHQPTPSRVCMYACAASHKREWQRTPTAASCTLFWLSFVPFSSMRARTISKVKLRIKCTTNRNRSQLQNYSPA